MGHSPTSRNARSRHPEYGARATRADDGYSSLRRDLLSHCCIFIGTQMDEPPFWQYITLRGDRPPGRELRPRSFLVTPSLSLARRTMLERFNIEHVPMSAEEFCERYVRDVAEHRPARSVAASKDNSPFVTLDVLPTESVESRADFLLGREPTWSDVREGFAIERAFEQAVLEAAEDGSVRTTVLTGTVGSGKSTTLRRLALTLLARGHRVLWLREDASQPVAQIASAAIRAEVALYVSMPRSDSAHAVLRC